MSDRVPGPVVQPLGRPVSALYGVGPERAGQLGRLGISTVEDLLLHRPRRYEDRTRFSPIGELRAGEAAVARGRVVACGVKWFRQHSKSIFELILEDGTGRLHCRWWNMPYLEKRYSRDDELVVYGKVLRVKPRTMDHPEVEVVESGEDDLLHSGRLTPIYPLTEGLPQRWLRSLIWRAVESWRGHVVDPLAGLNLAEAGPLAATLPCRAEAIRMLHQPASLAETERARQRLALDEFFELQHRLQLRRKHFQTKARSLPCGGDNRLIKPFLRKLGFKLTDAQTRVLRELRRDMSGAHPMRRLLQGDVGSGKTVVAACCALMALESGYNVALMAPTEILATQHFNTFSAWLADLGIRVEMRTGSYKTAVPPSAPRDAKAAARDGQSPAGAGSPTLHVGTHALLTEGFEMGNLGLVIIDEQHKFGVAQREQLVRKGVYPHLLVMTATPIPRTLGLTVYGELDVSILDELPPGRGRIQTFVRSADRLPKVWEFVRSQLQAGRQAYVVYPRVEETDGNQVKAVVQEYDRVKAALAPLEVGLLHGRMPSAEKEAVMQAFRQGAIKALLATSLIEVGVDVPNATIMVIENAEQFGLAQLHQLRGRIGRGAADAYCILVAAAQTPEARERLKVLESTLDGFQIAEADLRLRGPGELLGQQQSGMPRFRFADFNTDWPLIQLARRLAAAAVAG